jgi:hypothetical protein
MVIWASSSDQLKTVADFTSPARASARGNIARFAVLISVVAIATIPAL